MLWLVPFSTTAPAPEPVTVPPPPAQIPDIFKVLAPVVIIMLADDWVKLVTDTLAVSIVTVPVPELASNTALLVDAGAL